ncbi:tRNA(fMet)-specific endonuclease VapC [Salinibacter ruber]|nr:tRNA(fMet)-specific endonuclease VapC [Salinibacter ruber]
MALPSVARHELTYGAERMDEGRRHAYLAEYIHEVVRPSMPVLPHELPHDTTAAQWHGWARAALEEGLSTPFADGQIAAIAATEDLMVVTQDFEPFATLEDRIHLENWFSG